MRISLKKKYKIIQKVKERHRKKAKEAKKLGLHKKKKLGGLVFIDYPSASRVAISCFDEIGMANVAVMFMEIAQKRKLGLLEEGNMDEQSFKGENAADEFGDFVKNRDNSERAFYKSLSRSLRHLMSYWKFLMLVIPLIQSSINAKKIASVLILANSMAVQILMEEAEF
ncbi:hypothetical protein Cgig2_030044 [Carnegiea gigantea]|uniref:Uncharacterized protein n=1 Tax=Carnegiea gigantea TaxID=171969 RepID=A0A9Q1K1X7_9CARY|nr:hypothetical protein Cgig2_030044 [Carnegiea gigantea]